MIFLKPRARKDGRLEEGCEAWEHVNDAVGSGSQRLEHLFKHQAGKRNRADICYHSYGTVGMTVYIDVGCKRIQ